MTTFEVGDMVRVLQDGLALILGEKDPYKGQMGYVAELEYPGPTTLVQFSPGGDRIMYHPAELTLIGAPCPQCRNHPFHLMDMCKVKSCSCCDTIRFERNVQ